jgi:hypothetical protein
MQRSWQVACLLLTGLPFAPLLAAEPPAPPPGWTPFPITGPGTIAAYHVAEPDGSFHQSVTATVLSNYPSLDAFIEKNTRLLQSTPGYRIIGTSTTEACGQPAWLVIYTHEGNGQMPAFIDEQLVMVRNGRTVIAAYARLENDAERAEARKWMRGLCGLN